VGVDEGASEDRRTDLVKVELETGDDPEVAAAATDGPEQVGVLVVTGVEESAVGRDHVRPAEIVDREPVFRGEPAEAAADGQPGDAGRRVDAERRGEAERLGLVVHVGQRRAGLDPGDLRVGVDDDRVHRAAVEDDPAVGDGRAGDVVPAAADRERAVPFAGELDRVDHVADAGTADDEGRSAVDHAVPDLPGLVVRVVVRANDAPAQSRREGRDGLVVDG